MQAAVKEKGPLMISAVIKPTIYADSMVVFFLLFYYLPMPGLYYAFVDYDFMRGCEPVLRIQIFEFLFQEAWIPSSWKLTKNTILYNLAFIFNRPLAQIAVAVLLEGYTENIL